MCQQASVPPDINFALETVSNGPLDIELDRPDLDLTGPDAEMNLHAVGASVIAAAGSMNMDTNLGSSADKPIELDFDMDIFHDSTGSGSAVNGPMQGLFDTQPGTSNSHIVGLQGPKMESSDMNMEMFNNLSSVGGAGEDIFQSLDAAAAPILPPSNDSGATQSGISNSGLSVPPSDPSSTQIGASNANPAGSYDFNMDFGFDTSFLGSQPVDPAMNMMDMQNYFDLASSGGDTDKQNTQPS